MTPDLIIDINWPEAGRYLFRARPDEHHDVPLAGVRVHTLGAFSETDWTYLEPPLLPFSLPPLRNRYVGLHGAAALTPSGALILLLGERGAGKTTIALTLVNEHGCTLLTDETIFLHRRSRLVEAFPQPIGIVRALTPTLSKQPVRADFVCRRISSQPALATHLVMLEKSETENGFVPLDHATSLRKLLPHYRDVGCTLDEAMVTMWQLVLDLPSASLRYQTYSDLQACPSMLLAFTDGCTL